MSAEAFSDHHKNKQPISMKEAKEIMEDTKNLYKQFHEVLGKGIDTEKAVAMNMMVNLKRQADTYIRDRRG